MIEELVSRVFAARDIAHREHLRTASYAQHMALGEFYDAAIDAVDAIVECYQGEFGLIGDYQIVTNQVENISSWILAEMEWIAANHASFTNGSSSIGNLVDNLVAVYQRALYKLNYLS